MALTTNSKKKIEYLENTMDLLLTSGNRISGSLEDMRKVTDAIGYAAINRAYNVAVSMGNRLSEGCCNAAKAGIVILEEMAKDNFAGQDRKLAANRALAVAESVVGQIHTSELIADPDKGGMEEQLTPATESQFTACLVELLGARLRLVTALDEITRGTADEDFEDVKKSIGRQLEGLANETVDDYNKLNDALAVVGISISDLQEKAQEATANIDKVTVGSISTDLSGEVMDV